jgi:putative flavoprotein involved in K+ transport
MSKASGSPNGSRPAGPAEHFDTVVIGGGQAGLSVGYHLARLGQSFVILDRNRRVGDGWRDRYDSLRLFSPAKYSGLPGMTFPAPGYTFPSGRDMANYLEAYANWARLPVLTAVEVDGLWPADADGGYVITAGGRSFAAAQVVVATGWQRLPSIPSFASALRPAIRQVHSGGYRNPSQLLPGDVLVVGAGHSGADIALEAAAEHRTWLSGSVHGQVPIDIESKLARPVWWLLWFAASHILTVRTPWGRKLRPTDRNHGGPLVRARLPDLRAAGVRLVSARTVGVRDGLPELGDGQVLDVANVVWCTGFRHDFGWIHLPVMDEYGWPVHHRGVAASAPGLYFAGLPFQYAFTSMLVGGVGRDARHVAQHIAARRSQGRPGEVPGPRPAHPAGLGDAPRRAPGRASLGSGGSGARAFGERSR